MIDLESIHNLNLFWLIHYLNDKRTAKLNITHYNTDCQGIKDNTD